MNDDNTLVGRILSWTRLHENSDQIVKWIEATESTTNAHKEAVIDDLLIDDPFTVLENKLNENKKERMIDDLLGDNKPTPWTWYLNRDSAGKH